MNENLLPVKSRQPGLQKGNRGKIEIIGDILGVCLAGDAKRTHIMYRSNLSHDMLKAYTDELISKGLVELDSTKSHFRTTDRGKDFLNHYSKIREILDVSSPVTSTQTGDSANPGNNLQSLGMSQDFLRRVKMSADQARGILKGMLYLKERYDVE